MVRWRLRALLAAVVAAALFSAPHPRIHRSRFDALPPLTLWAWERPEDLRGLPRDTAVAFLAQTITLDRDVVRVTPRRQPLRVSPHTPLIAVTRVESRPLRTGPDRTALEAVAEAIATTAHLPRVAAVQVDFDAVRSQRASYRDLLERLRARLPPATALSITALASWCMDDNWIDELPVDEAVPMLFQMGPTERHVRLDAAGHLRAGACGTAVGTALDEPIALPRARRIYAFSPSAWDSYAIADARRRLLLQ